MPTVPPPVPRVRYEGRAAYEQLVVVVERVLYILRWLADNPTGLLEGRHHDTLRKALDELEKRLQQPPPASEPPASWEKAIWACDYEQLESAGLAGEQLALKLGIFNQLFEEFLDMTAERGSKDTELIAKQIEDFKRRVLPWYRRPLRRGATITRALKAGTTVVASIGSVVVNFVTSNHYVKFAFDAIKEVSEFAQHGIAHLDAKR